MALPSTGTSSASSTVTTSGTSNDASSKFKKYSLSSYASKVKKNQWKSLKQIITTDKMLPWNDAITYSSLNPPPSFRPSKKYSDISGLAAYYTDPESKLRYHNGDEYAIVKTLPMDLSSGYLSLRGASNAVG